MVGGPHIVLDGAVKPNTMNNTRDNARRGSICGGFGHCGWGIDWGVRAIKRAIMCYKYVVDSCGLHLWIVARYIRHNAMQLLRLKTNGTPQTLTTHELARWGLPCIDIQLAHDPRGLGCWLRGWLS